MDFLSLAAQRFSVRKFQDRPVEPEKVDALLKAASLAPTGCNKQPQRILVVDDPAVLAKIRKATTCQFGAPLTFVVCYDKKACWINPEGKPIGDVDAAIVTTHIMLEAAEQGLGSCWVAFFQRDALIKELDIPQDYIPVALLPVGYPAPDASPAPQHASHKSSSAFTWKNHF